MKHLLEYLTEALTINEAEGKYDALIQKLASNTELGKYVDYLNAMIKDKDAREVLTKAFMNAEGEDHLEFDGKMKVISVRDLHPTQSEIDVNKSIGYPFKGVKEAKENMDKFFEHADNVVMPFPLVTFNGQFIVDGHHRWSQVYSFNPEAKMECFDLTVENGDKISPQDMLKIVQGLLATKRVEDGKGDIPKAVVEGANLFKMSEDEVKNAIISYCDKSEEVTKIICEACNKGNAEKLAGYLCANLMLLRKDNEKYAAAGNNRGVMPQTDRGGDNPDDMKSARPDASGSALDKLVNAKVDKDVLPSK